MYDRDSVRTASLWVLTFVYESEAHARRGREGTVGAVPGQESFVNVRNRHFERSNALETDHDRPWVASRIFAAHDALDTLIYFNPRRSRGRWRLGTCIRGTGSRRGTPIGVRTIS